MAAGLARQRLTRAGLLVLLGCAGAGNTLAQQPGPIRGEVGRSPTIISAEVASVGALTCVRLTTIGKAVPTVYRVANPDRVVLDAAGTRIRFSRRPDAATGSVVSALRYGRLKNNIARIVFDVADGTQLAGVAQRSIGNDRHQIIVGLGRRQGGAKVEQCAMMTATQADRRKLANGNGRVGQIKSGRGPRADRPVIVIDPGHGGIDPGAVVNGGYLEKVIVLAVAKNLARRLRGMGGFDVVLTRTKDVFVSLDDRIELSRGSGGDVFISLHADSISDDTQARAASGAAVYTLSVRASNAAAKRLADKENASDLLAGVLPKTSASSGVRNILVDLLKRETQRASARLRKVMVDAMRGKVKVSRKPLRSAAFHVLKQTETPGVLIELGYMTNPHDLLLMRQAAWQERMADAIADAVKGFFSDKRN